MTKLEEIKMNTRHTMLTVLPPIYRTEMAQPDYNWLISQAEMLEHTLFRLEESRQKLLRVEEALKLAEWALQEISDEDIDNIAGESACIADGALQKIREIRGEEK